MHVAGSDLTTGYHASAINVGQLQRVLERGLARFHAGQIRERWPEIKPWISRVVRVWVQRVKRVAIESTLEGIRVEIETQDDLGYYGYSFDVFPERGRRR